MDWVIWNGQSDVVRFLLENREEGYSNCTPSWAFTLVVWIISTKHNFDENREDLSNYFSYKSHIVIQARF